MDGIEKQVGLADDYLNEGEQRLVPLVACRGRLEVDDRLSRGHVKTAASAEALDAAALVKPHPDRVYVMVIGLGSSEYWGTNNNGDSFPEAALLGRPPADVTMSFFDKYKGRMKPVWGHSTFRQAHAFQEHQNSNPRLAIGGIHDTFWNGRMHRVENIAWLDRHNPKGKKWVTRIDAGEPVGTSMACKVPFDRCFPAGTLVSTINGHVPIEQIQVGDLVTTHLGRLRAVTVSYPKLEVGEMIKIKAVGTPEIKATENHPFLILRHADVRSCVGSANGKLTRHQPQDGKCRRCKRELDYVPVWTESRDLRVGDYLLSVLDECADTVSSGLDLARLVGYYLGDGYIISQKSGKKKQGERKDMGVGFSVGIHEEEHLGRIIETLNAVGVDNEPNVYDAGCGRQAVMVNVYSRGLAEMMQALGGRGTHKKRVAPSIHAWSTEEKLALLGGWIDTDGHFDEKKGSTRITTVNRGLALDARRLCLSVGIPASVVNGGEIKEYGTSKGTGETCWHVFIPASYAKHLDPYSIKVKPFETEYSNSQGFFWGGYYATPVRAIEEIDGDVEVFNLGIEEDESYVVEGVVVHNCSVCGNLAPTRAQYCNHLRLGAPGYAMRQIRPDGKTVSMVNDFPVFFDESFVETPAAPEALMIMKVAAEQEKLAQIAKNAEIKKTGPDLPLDVAMDDLHGLYDHESPLPAPVVAKLATVGLQNAIKAAASLGMCLRPSEVFGIHFGIEKFARGELDALDACCLFVKPHEVKSAKLEGTLTSITDHVKVARAVDLLRPFASGRSYQEPHITGRLMRKLGSFRPFGTPAPSDQMKALIGVYHTLYKAACGEYGYGTTQLSQTAASRFGGY